MIGELIRKTFEGQWVPVKPHWSFIHDPAFSGKSPTVRSESSKTNEGKMQARIGVFEQRENKKDGSKYWQLKITLPFAVRASFVVKKNENKTKDTAPDQKIFYAGIEVGAIWNKVQKSDPSKKYKSGEVLCPFLPDGKGKLSFAIFPSEDEKSSSHWVVSDFGRESAPKSAAESGPDGF